MLKLHTQNFGCDVAAVGGTDSVKISETLEGFDSTIWAQRSCLDGVHAKSLQRSHSQITHLDIIKFRTKYQTRICNWDATDGGGHGKEKRATSNSVFFTPCRLLQEVSRNCSMLQVFNYRYYTDINSTCFTSLFGAVRHPQLFPS